MRFHMLLPLVAFFSMTMASPGAIPGGFSMPMKRSDQYFGSTDFKGVYARERAHAQRFIDRFFPHLKNQTETKRTTGYYLNSLSNQGYITYLLYGSLYEVLLDTSNSISWLGSNKPFYRTNTTVESGRLLNVCWSGNECLEGPEIVGNLGIWDGMATTLKTDGVKFGAVMHTTNWDSEVSGILGLGPYTSSVGDITTDPNGNVPSLINYLWDNSVIDKNIFTLRLRPWSGTGTLGVGGVDNTMWTGPIPLMWQSVTSMYPSSQFWGFKQSISYGNISGLPIMLPTSGVIDSTSVMTFLPTDAFNRYIVTIGAAYDDDVDLYYLTPEQYANLQSLFFVIAGVGLEFVANAQVWPRSLNTAIGGDATNHYLILGDLGVPTGSGLDFILGITWLQRFFTAYDFTQHKIGFATTSETYSTSN